MNHAWSACKIDNGEWKLMDPCWGSGHIKGANQPYTRHFSHEFFDMSNDEFGMRHFPDDNRYFFRDDGRRSITWEEYMMCDSGPEKLTVYTGTEKQHGFDEKSFSPKWMDVKINDENGGPTVRFQWNKICPHYDISKHGKPYLFFIKLKRADDEDDWKVFKTDGYYWWLDVNRRDLGKPGDDLFIGYMQTYNTTNIDGRGITEDQLMKGVKMRGPQGWNTYQINYMAKYRVA
jgi:hypothetical protein